MTYGDGVCAGGERFAAHVCEQARDLVLVDLVQFGPAPLAGVEDVLPQQFLGNFGCRGGGGAVTLLFAFVDVHAVLVGGGGLGLRTEC